MASLDKSLLLESLVLGEAVPETTPFDSSSGVELDRGSNGLVEEKWTNGYLLHKSKNDKKKRM